MKESIRVSIVGLGETGVTIGSLLMACNQKIELNIMDPSDWIKGRLLDLNHAAAFRRSMVSLNDKEAFELADFIFFCAGVRNLKGADRFTTVKENKGLIELVFEGVQLKNKPTVIVVTNPVELISAWMQDFLGNSAVVVGTGTMLDTERLRYILSREFNVNPSQIETEVLGEHGDSMVIAWSKTRVNGKAIDQVSEQLKRNRILDELIGSAATIRQTEEATKFGVGQCAVELFLALLREEETYVPVSFLPEKNQRERFQVTTSVFMSLPVCMSAKGIFAQSALHLNPEEQNLLQLSIRKLEEVYTSLETS